MGAVYCCSQDERKNSFKAYVNNFRLTGVDGLGDLDSKECGTEYRNSFEVAEDVNLTHDSIAKLYSELMISFS